MRRRRAHRFKGPSNRITRPVRFKGPLNRITRPFWDTRFRWPAVGGSSVRTTVSAGAPRSCRRPAADQESGWSSLPLGCGDFGPLLWACARGYLRFAFRRRGSCVRSVVFAGAPSSCFSPGCGSGVRPSWLLRGRGVGCPCGRARVTITALLLPPPRITCPHGGCPWGSAYLPFGRLRIRRPAGRVSRWGAKMMALLCGGALAQDSCAALSAPQDSAFPAPRGRRGGRAVRLRWARCWSHHAAGLHPELGPSVSAA